MSKCAKFWQKHHQLEDEIKDIQGQIYQVDLQLQAKPNDPMPFIKHKQLLEEKARYLHKKKESTYLAAVNCDAKEHQNALKKDKQ